MDTDEFTKMVDRTWASMKFRKTDPWVENSSLKCGKLPQVDNQKFTTLELLAVGVASLVIVEILLIGGLALVFGIPG